LTSLLAMAFTSAACSYLNNRPRDGRLVVAFGTARTEERVPTIALEVFHEFVKSTICVYQFEHAHPQSGSPCVGNILVSRI